MTLPHAAQESPPAITLPNLNLPTEDGVPLDTPRHRAQIELLLELTHAHWHERTDFYAGGNMFIYYSLDQAHAIINELADEGVGQPPPVRRAYRGPDFFVVKDVDGTRYRNPWVVWEEGGRYPDLIIELLSPSTARTDKEEKKQLYERTFRTPEYFCYDPITHEFLGWRLRDNRYEAIEPDARNWFWSAELQLHLGTWEGRFVSETTTWLRFFTTEGDLVLTEKEAEHQRAEAERQRAEAAEAEVERLRARLAELENDPNSTT